MISIDWLNYILLCRISIWYSSASKQTKQRVTGYSSSTIDCHWLHQIIQMWIMFQNVRLVSRLSHTCVKDFTISTYMCWNSSTTVVSLDVLRIYSAYTWLQIRDSSSRTLARLSVRTVYYTCFPLTLYPSSSKLPSRSWIWYSVELIGYGLYRIEEYFLYLIVELDYFKR